MQLYSPVRMDEPSQLANATATERLLELGSVLDASLSDWNVEGSNQTQAEKNDGSLSTNGEPSSGTKDPTKSVTCDAKLKKKGEKAPRGGDSYMKQTVMLVVSLRGVKFRFWSRLRCSGQSANILSRQGLV